MKIQDLIGALKDNGIDLLLCGEELEISYEGDELAEADLTKIKSYKAEIIAFLKQSFLNEDAIPTAEVQACYPLSSSQRRLWIQSQFDEANVAYNMPGVFVFEGDLNTNALESAINSVIERHESLRTVFKLNGSGEIKQLIKSPQELGFKISTIDLRSTENADGEIEKLIHLEFVLPFDLGEGPLIRVNLFLLDTTKWVFTYVMHHIISDGWSMNILIKEILSFYNNYNQGKKSDIKQLRIQYKDYAVWQQAFLTSENLSRYKSYWLDQFQGELPVLDFPTTYPRPLIRAYRGDVYNRKIDSAITRKLKALSLEHGGTLFMGLLTSVKILLFRYSNQTDIIIGSPVAGRDHVDLEDQIGFYVNTLALRTKFAKDDTFIDLFNAIKQVTLDAFEHQAYPFDELINELALAGNTGRNPLFDVLVALQNIDVFNEEKSEAILGNVKTSSYNKRNHVTSKFDLFFDFKEVDFEINIGIHFNTDIFNKETIEQLTSHFIQLLSSIVENPSLPINTFELFNTEQKNEILIAFNDTKVAYPKKKTIVDLFEEQVLKTPDQIAVVFEEKKLSYKELDEQANHLANYLQERYQIKPDDLIGVKQNRSEWVIISILGVLKSGGAYVPIDMDYPQERIDYIENDTKSKVCIDENELTSFRKSEKKYSKKKVTSITTPDHLAYVIYTSGSTGKPKGVMVEHKNLVHSTTARTRAYKDPQLFLLLSSISFDSSIAGIFGTLVQGGQLVLTSAIKAIDLDSILETIEQNKISQFLAVPSLYKLLLNRLGDKPNTLKAVTVAGEECLKSLVDLHYSSPHMANCELYNEYGPTECSVWATYLKYVKNEVFIPTIGKPISNTQIYILSEKEILQPKGVIGEIYIGGEGLTRGYLNQEVLTAEKFIPNPFKEGERLYKTGDLGRWLNDGNIEFIGRKDDQVKIRGYRIELGEIEHALLTNKHIKEAVVLAKENENKEKEIVAYITSKEDQNIHDLRSYLKGLVPEYMLPAYFIQLESLPLTSNGKINKKALPDPKGVGLSTGVVYMAPRNATEDKMVRIWEEILQRDSIGIRDDFFALGGNSLKTVRLSNEYKKKLGVNILIKDLFVNTSIESHVDILRASETIEFLPIEKVALQESYPVSNAQRSLWVMDQFDGAAAAYNLSSTVTLNKEIDIKLFKKAILATIARHEILRTVFRQDEDGQPRQWILPLEELSFEVIQKNFRGINSLKNEITDFIKSDLSTPFDLKKGPLLKAYLLQLEDAKYLFYYNMHHIICDGLSLKVLERDVMAYYYAFANNSAPDLPVLNIQYKDFAAWQKTEINEAILQVQKTYLQNKFKNDLPKLNLIGAKERPRLKTYNGSTLGGKLESETSKKLKHLAHQKNTTLYMNLLSIVSILIYKNSFQTDIIFGLPVSNRSHADLENQIGIFVNTIPIRIELNTVESYSALLSDVRDNVLESFAHQNYPFDLLVKDLSLKRDASRNPIFDVSVIMNEVDHIKSRLDGNVTGGETDSEHEILTESKFDMSFYFNVSSPDISFDIVYNTDLFDRSFMKRMSKELKMLIQEIAKDTDMTVDALREIITEESEMAEQMKFEAGFSMDLDENF